MFGVLNDGSLHVSSLNDPLTRQVGSCYSFYRNTVAPVHVRVTYKANRLEVSIDTDYRGAAYVPCFSVNDVKLPEDYYFGVSSATGELADDHDVISFDVYDLNPPPVKIKVCLD